MSLPPSVEGVVNYTYRDLALVLVRMVLGGEEGLAGTSARVTAMRELSMYPIWLMALRKALNFLPVRVFEKVAW